MDHLYKPATPSFAAMHWKAWKTPLYWWIVPGTYHKNRTKQSLLWFLDIVRYQQIFKTYQWHMKACNIFRPIKLYMIYYLQFDKTASFIQDTTLTMRNIRGEWSIQTCVWSRVFTTSKGVVKKAAVEPATPPMASCICQWTRLKEKDKHTTSCHESLDHSDKVCQSCSFYKFTYETQI